MCCAVAETQARLGETREQIESRFGAPIRETRLESLEMDQFTYVNNDLRIGVVYADGRSVSEQYLRITPAEAGEERVVPLPGELAGAILQAQAEGQTWNPKETLHPAHRHFSRSDGKAYAAYSVINNEIAAVLLARPEFFERLTGKR